MCLQDCLLTVLMVMEPAIHLTEHIDKSCVVSQKEVQVACKDWVKSPRNELVKVAKTHIREDEPEECFSYLGAEGLHVVGEPSHH